MEWTKWWRSFVEDLDTDLLILVLRSDGQKELKMYMKQHHRFKVSFSEFPPTAVPTKENVTHSRWKPDNINANSRML